MHFLEVQFEVLPLVIGEDLRFDVFFQLLPVVSVDGAFAFEGLYVLRQLIEHGVLFGDNECVRCELAVFRIELQQILFVEQYQFPVFGFFQFFPDCYAPFRKP